MKTTTTTDTEEQSTRNFDAYLSAAIGYHGLRVMVSKGEDRVLRGGSWNNNARNTRSAYRNRNQPSNRNNNVGFRLARAQIGAGWRKIDPTVIRFDGIDDSAVPFRRGRQQKATYLRYASRAASKRPESLAESWPS